jgi:hypothetical protein
MPEQRAFVAQDIAQRAGEIGFQEAQAVAFGQADIEGGKIQRGQILVAPAAWRLLPHLGAMQVDQRQARRAGIDRQVQQEVADVEIAMVDAAAVHAPRHLGHAPDQRALESRRRRHGAPVAAEILEADGGREFFGDDEGLRRAGLLPRSPKATARMVSTPRAASRSSARHSLPAPSTGRRPDSRFLKISPQPTPRWILA